MCLSFSREPQHRRRAVCAGALPGHARAAAVAPVARGSHAASRLPAACPPRHKAGAPLLPAPHAQPQLAGQPAHSAGAQCGHV